MGVLAPRLHASITAIAAVAAVSASIELSDKPALTSFFSATGQTLLLSSIYAPTASSSFEGDFGLAPPSNLPMVTMALPHRTNTSPVLRTLPAFRTGTNIITFSPFVSQSSAIHFYKAESVLQQFPPSHSHPASRLLLYSMNPAVSVVHYSKLGTTTPLILHNSLRSIRTTSWKYPQIWHAHTTANHPLAAQISIPRIPQGFQFEKVLAFVYGAHAFPPLASTALLHLWHGPLNTNPESDDGEKQLFEKKPAVAVVLLGWLGAEHRHLKKYADWYTSRGIHAVTFVVPMKDLMTLKAGDKAEKHVDVLTQNLVQWLKDDAGRQGSEKIVIFHTFSNTGWLTYGAVLERLICEGDELLEKIKGCVVDSAPSARPDPQVWASGFSAALLKKSSVATQMLPSSDEDADSWNGVIPYPKPSLKETALLAMLEKFFSVFLQIPYVNRRLNDVVSVLANQQPSCPQLYIYSSADTVIPAKSVESFIEEQKKAGYMVSACNFQCSPHVDHFRTFPEKYSEQLTSFLKVCLPQLAVQ